MCESHINDTIRRLSDIRSVKSDRHKNEAVVIAEVLDTARIVKEIKALGYDAELISAKPYQKRTFFSRLKR